MIKRNLIIMTACLATLSACSKREVKVAPQPTVVEAGKITKNEAKEVYTEKDPEPAQEEVKTYALGEKLPIIQKNVKASKALANKRIAKRKAKRKEEADWELRAKMYRANINEDRATHPSVGR